MDKKNLIIKLFKSLRGEKYLQMITFEEMKKKIKCQKNIFKFEINTLNLN